MIRDLLKTIREADLVITIGQDGVRTIKSRFGEEKGDLDLCDILEILIDYEKEESLKPLIKTWINKLKIYRTFL